jgi:hypothetical protein
LLKVLQIKFIALLFSHKSTSFFVGIDASKVYIGIFLLRRPFLDNLKLYQRKQSRSLNIAVIESVTGPRIN